MKAKILFLTNNRNGSSEEDELLFRFLRHDFDLVVRHPLECLPVVTLVDGIIIRNIWPTHEYQKDWEEVKWLLRAANVPVYNPLTFKGDIEGKDYLTDLHTQGYPVIPSIRSVRDLETLPVTEFYWIKPKLSCDGFGAERITRAELLRRDPEGYIIQPFLEFEYEPSFFFIDNRFECALWAKHRLHDDRSFTYMSTVEDLDFATQFVKWADMAYGIQRIDAVRTRDGNLLLTEVENLCPYLYIGEMENQQQKEFLSAMKASLVRVFYSRSWQELVNAGDSEPSWN